jgi:hypothetical protein
MTIVLMEAGQTRDKLPRSDALALWGKSGTQMSTEHPSPLHQLESNFKTIVASLHSFHQTAIIS